MKIDGHHPILHFMCQISAASAHKGKVKVGFVLVKGKHPSIFNHHHHPLTPTLSGDQATMDNGMDQVLQLWNQYEQDARAVAMANGWLFDKSNSTITTTQQSTSSIAQT